MDLWHHPFRPDACAWDDNEGIDRINTNEYYCHSTAKRLIHGYRRRPYVPGGPEDRELRRRRREPEPDPDGDKRAHPRSRSEEHTSELQSLMRTSYAVFCL